MSPRITLSAMLLVSACATVAGLDDYESGTGTGGVGGGGEGGSACPVVVPEGWLGPAAIYEGEDDPPSCGALWKMAISGGTDPVRGSCDCACSIDPSPETQSEACFSDVTWTLEWSVSPFDNCGDSTTAVISQDECVDPMFQQSVLSAKASPMGSPSGLCSPAGPTAPLEPPDFTTKLGACIFEGALDDAVVCERQVPSGYEPRLCLYQNGDVACPDGYTDRRVVQTELTDELMCNCGCDDADLRCEGSIGLYNTSACGGAPPHAIVPADDKCHTLNAPVATDGLLVAFSQVTGACIQLEDVPGSPTASGDLTVCCQPP